jgi:hypothetical protein
MPNRCLSWLAALFLPLAAWAQDPPAAAAPPNPLRTTWADAVPADQPWPEYPRPTLRRTQWWNLNGRWDYAITAAAAPQMPERADGQILVPFPLESVLSGVGVPLRPDQRLWYRRQFVLPDLDGWRGRRILLHLEAADWQVEAWVDGTPVGTHRGGYDRATFEVTAALGERREHSLCLAVRDPSDAGPQPRGKQVQKPNGIWYTPTSGLWQSVWLEPVPQSRIAGVRCLPNNHGVQIEATGHDLAAGDAWQVVLGTTERRWEHTGPDATSAAVLPWGDAPLWGPGHPHLLPFTLRLWRGAQLLDEVVSYTARRELRVGPDAHGTTRLLLNGEPLFQFGPLDQGYWPDGLYTPPNHAAQCADLDTIAAMGCNMLRKHVKVENELYYWECDRRGLLVWQDMPSGDTQRDPETFERELRALVAGRFAHPSIVMWVVFNEGWGQHDTKRYVDLVRSLDPTRWLGNASGWTDQHCGDVVDVHVYPGPGMAPPEPPRASVLGEFGGFGLPLAGHTWASRDNWGYVSFADREALTAAYVQALAALRPLVAQGLSAAVYTQTTDVEVECNGWLTYDRKVAKVDAAQAAAAARTLYAAPGHLAVVAPTARDGLTRWRWTTAEPPADWAAPAFDDQGWDEGPGGFGTKGTPGARIGTGWATPAIWLRRRIEVPAGGLQDPFWCVHHDEDVEVCVDGMPVFAAAGYTTGYQYVPLGTAARAALGPGPHLLAVRCRQTRGGQFVDVGLSDLQPAAK